MTDTKPLPPEEDSPDRLPRHTTPTWEVELLISGIAVFAMLQLPGWLDDQLFALQPRFGTGWEMPLLMIYLYLKSAAVILAITFAMHLLLRAQWIAMVGMHSVFPDGIRWERLRMGPVQREVEMRQYGSAGASIERADNRATILFSIGVMLASNLLLISVLCIGVFALAVAMIKAFGVEADLGSWFVYCLLGVMMPVFLFMAIDRHLGARLRTDGPVRRALAAILRFYSRLGLMSRGSNPVFSLLSSHGGERRAIALTTTIIIVVAVGVMFSLNSMKDPGKLGGYSMFPAFSDGSRTLESAHYDDQRNPARDRPVAYITSAIVVGPYLRLTVPYQTEGDTTGLHRNCPIPSTSRGDARAVLLLACLQRVHAVMLDGKPLPSLQYEAGSDARTDRPALVAMIDVRALAPGRHDLQVTHARGRDNEGKDASRSSGDAWRIPFWR